MTADPGSRNKRSELIQGILILAIALLCSWTTVETFLGRFAGQWTLVRFIRSGNFIDEDRIVLIDITEEDYVNVFGRKRPLEPAKIVDLIRAAHSAKAKVIAVDINTADWPKDWERTAPLPSDTSIVWARDFYRSHEGRQETRTMDPLLGGVASSIRECYGLPALAVQAGVYHGFYSALRVGDSYQPSFITQIVQRSTHGSCLQPNEQQGEELSIIDFSSRIRSESASTLLMESNQKDWPSRAEYSDKTVIIGGSFHAGSDLDFTPVGDKSGLEINGHALSSVLRNTARKQLHPFYAFVIDTAVGAALLVSGFRSKTLQLTITLTLLPLMPILSFFVFRQYYLFVSSFPLMAGIATHLYLAYMHRRSDSASAQGAQPGTTQKAHGAAESTTKPLIEAHGTEKLSSEQVVLDERKHGC
jgi:hypothetical protein